MVKSKKNFASSPDNSNAVSAPVTELQASSLSSNQQMNDEKQKLLEKIAAIERIVEEAAKCRYAYFWTPGSSAGSRRSAERWHSVPEVCWTDGKDSYSAEFRYSESCHHVYAKGYYYRNGERTTLTAINNSLKRLKAAYDTDN